jgi:guanosine-3',5'-bis(diphosphate) 3'-pyrophosphohydrolase
LQIEHAPHLSPGAALIKLGDKIYNVRELGDRPPVGWSRDRLREYLTWAESVIAQLPKVNPALEAYFQNVLSESRKKIS